MNSLEIPWSWQQRDRAWRKLADIQHTRQVREMKERRRKPEIRELKSYPDSRLEVLKRNSGGSLTCQFIHDCPPYRQGDKVNVLPHETTVVLVLSGTKTVIPLNPKTGEADVQT